MGGVLKEVWRLFCKRKVKRGSSNAKNILYKYNDIYGRREVNDVAEYINNDYIFTKAREELLLS